MTDSYQPPPPGSDTPPPPPPGGWAAPPPASGNPASGGPLGNPTALAFPWEDRQRLGFGQAFVESVRMIATQPSAAFGRLRSDGDYVGPFVFGLLISWAMFLIGQMWGLMLGSYMPFNELAGSTGATLVTIAVYTIVWPVIFAVVLFVSSGIYHLCLMLLSALDQSHLGFEGTYKVVAYSQVATLVAIIPILGPLVGWVLQIVLFAVGFQAAHRAGQGQSIAAAVIPALLCCGCAMAVAFFFGAAIVAAAAGGVG